MRVWLGADGNVLHDMNWGFLEDDVLIGKLLERRRKSARLKRNFVWEEVRDVCGVERSSFFAADERKYLRLKRVIGEWKEARAEARDAEKEADSDRY